MAKFAKTGQGAFIRGQTGTDGDTAIQGFMRRSGRPTTIEQRIAFRVLYDFSLLERGKSLHPLLYRLRWSDGWGWIARRIARPCCWPDTTWLVAARTSEVLN